MICKQGRLPAANLLGLLVEPGSWPRRRGCGAPNGLVSVLECARPGSKLMMQVVMNSRVAAVGIQKRVFFFREADMLIGV